MPSNLALRLEQGLEAMALPLNAKQQSLLLDYLALLEKWNKAYNLTAVRDPEDMLVQHIFDSLSVFEYVNSGSCMDVGAGAGLPGMVLAIARPEQRWTLIDSNNKKTRFMQQAVIELGLQNVEVVHARIESLTLKPEMIICRAFSSLKDFIDLCRPMIKPEAILLAMKSQTVQDEIAELDSSFSCEVIELTYPEQEATRFLVKISPVK